MAPAMNQKLRILVLKHLSMKPRAGYGLIKDINECTGWKPSYGSMYPLLEHLKEEGLVEVEEKGNKKVYHLTDKGKEEVHNFHKMHADMLMQMRDKMKLMTHMLGFTDERHDELMDLFFSAAQKGEMPFKEVMKSTTEMKMVFWELYKQGTIKKHAKDINKIMNEATAKIKKLAVKKQ
ncbi:helix-turn-helix transcriptional regulator [Candidatus Woesearchaeota archaeon]|nr:helix-turn-helix transcriptional regulator [Candidatus Woesearchaeota archaeon]